MSDLAKLVEGRLFAYIYRLTLDYDLAQDLLQETLLKMVNSLSELERIDRFWPWLLRTAMGKVQQHFSKRNKDMMKISAFSMERLSEYSSQNHDDGLNGLIRKELSDAIFQAMTKLKLVYRNVLVLRCFEQLSYAEIADLMGCKELRARVLFFRAKFHLKRQLSHRGFGRELLLVGLGLFGLMTAPAKAASATSTITAASLEVGFLASLVGIAGTKIGFAAMTAVAALAVILSVEKLILLVILLFYIWLCLFVFICARQ
jgi:RNA polymerase sigma-70 factor (ECF subfamily)